ncbi:MAG: hypothetical protein ACLFRV_04895 [Acidimicrobiales bacterium]
MAFGQQPGPPASHRQMQQLTDLVHQAGHVDFRDARGPLGLNQRQAGGKFTRDEADELIARLEAETEDAPGDAVEEEPPGPSPSAAIDRRQAEQARSLQKVSDQVLAAELQRRGWVVMEP